MDSQHSKPGVKRNYLIAILLASLFLFACSLFAQAPNIFQEGETTGSDVIKGVSIANGERIYFTATSARGGRISYSGGPNFGGMMMGSYLTCASCHGPEGRGGLHQMHMQLMDAPDIRYVALSGETGGHEEDEHENDHGEYGLEEFHRAVVEGQHPGGESLSREMPRWQISDEDLADLLAFLKAIP
ncbi:MAG: cytochrome c [Anaerolineales bacterium]|nr:cytochrome c [Anaerolineales bacterium]